MASNGYGTFPGVCKQLLLGTWSKIGKNVPYKVHCCFLEKSSPRICTKFNYCPEFEGKRSKRLADEHFQALHSGSILDFNLIIVALFGIVLPFIVAVNLF
ncbi:hypothetical protein KR026_008971 [Drosophila bipectinata]|nr:hypothetical protein KR026_008971 [Drosophila bipectinata]